MTWRERVLLALTIVGFLVPNAMVIAFVIEHGLDVGGYFSHWGESLPAAQLAADVSIAFLAFALWSAWEGRRIGMRTWWLPIPASLLVGLCFALPLFLLLRERALRELPPGLEVVGGGGCPSLSASVIP
jgi:putative Ca2+/H+ antiporter (TMEM165/GDT1 family)